MKTSEQLRELFSPGQLDQLDVVRQRMLEEPTALDNHSREVRTTPTEEKASA
jgi:hypothetical protein